MSKNEKDSYLLYVHTETNRGYLVSDTDNDKDGVWLPKSQIETDGQDVCLEPLSKMYYFDIPLWLAEEKGLV